MPDDRPTSRSLWRTRRRTAVLVYALLVVLLVVAGVLTSGLGPGLGLLGGGVVPVALVVLATARTRFAVWRSVRGGLGLLAGGVALLLTGGVLALGTSPAGSAAPIPTRGTSADVGAGPTTRTTSPAATPSTPAVPSTPAPAGPTALAVLATLPVKGRAPLTGYDRAAFGQTWKDTDRNGCDTRDDVLGRDLSDRLYAPGTRDCVVLSGTLSEPYTGRTLAFVRGVGTSEAVQVDHVVALGNAWQTGAQGWSVAERGLFANDPLNLLAVDGPTNQSKGAGDAATWLPPNRSYRCAYVARQVAVKARYGAWVTPAEKAAVERVLAVCPGERAPTGGTTPQQRATEVAGVVALQRSAADKVAAEKVAAGNAAADQPATPPAPSDHRTGACKAAVAAGLGPYVRGQDPEYGWYRDADGDGVVCER